jgi:hypothetical protein
MKALVVALCLMAVGLAAALDFEMQTQTKCIFEELNANVIVVGDYKATNKDNPTLPVYVDVKVRMVLNSKLGGSCCCAAVLLFGVVWPCSL